MDFAKAFDTIDWSFIFKILQARGFGGRWYGWIQSLLSSGLSGTPFRCKRGLRQGGPLSPYLFILGVDVLSCIMKLVYEGGFVQKVGPWNPGIACLQYADDTLMLLLSDLVSIKRVKILLYIFELLSGLSINFNKSSLYQLGPPCLDLAAVSGAVSYTHLTLPTIYSV